MSEPKTIVTNDSITVVLPNNPKPYVVKKGAANFINLKNAIFAEDWDKLPEYLTVAGSVSKWSNDKFKLDDASDVVTYLDKEVAPKFAKRILKMASEGEDPTTLFNFYERLQRNPSWRSVEQLWDFLNHEGIPLTPDGCFLAYKGVKMNFKDAHSGKIDNHVGNTIEVPRNSVSDDPRTACHFGLHVGAKQYAESFSEQLIICKVDPEDVVCVPYDSSQHKMRVCKYTVVGMDGGELSDTIHKDTLPVDTEEREPEIPDGDGDEDTNEGEDQDFVHEDDGDEDPVFASADDPEDDDEVAQDVHDDIVENDPGDDEDEGITAGRMRATNEPKPKVTYHATEKDKPKTKVTHAPKKKLSKDYRKYKAMDLGKLMEQPISDLRQYATYGLDIVGASKIPGGKTALAQRIIKVRDRR